IPAAPTRIHFGKGRALAGSGVRRLEGGRVGASSLTTARTTARSTARKTAGGVETGGRGIKGTEIGDETVAGGGAGAGGGTVGSGAEFRAALISARVQRACGSGSAA